MPNKQYKRLYKSTVKKYILSRPYLGIYEGEKGDLFLKEKWILELAKSL